MRYAVGLNRVRLSLADKLFHVNWLLVLLSCLTAGVGFTMLVSAASGNLQPWAQPQMIRFGIGLIIMLVIAVVDIGFWLRAAYMIYGLAFVLLVVVEIIGERGMGAQRWIALGPVQLQPSELMKIALVMALGRYFHGVSLETVARPTFLLAPLFLTVLPAALVLRQPDLGTAAVLLMIAAVVIYLAGVKLWQYCVVLVVALGAIPVAWQFLRDYQKTRIMTFLDPERDPLGAGYHIIQSKIALGSGGLLGKGYLEGTQSHLNFLPEKQTDFIFTMLAEEFGLVGALGLLALYFLVIVVCFAISMRCVSVFGRLVGMGVTATFFFYVFINIAMVMGLVPVVGMPLPLISYGGSAMMTLLIGFGLVLNAAVHRDQRIDRRGRTTTV
jgi:rod shape determining protein RodA